MSKYAQESNQTDSTEQSFHRTSILTECGLPKEPLLVFIATGWRSGKLRLIITARKCSGQDILLFSCAQGVTKDGNFLRETAVLADKQTCERRRFECVDMFGFDEGNCHSSDAA